MRFIPQLIFRCLAMGLALSAPLLAGAPAAIGETVVANQPAVLEKVISDPRLQAFLHPELSERFPLQVSLPEGVESGHFSGIDVGVPAVYLSADVTPDPTRANLIVSKMELDDSGGSVAFRLPIEGLAGTARLSRENGSWSVSSMHLVER